MIDVREVKVGKKLVGEGHPSLIIAEMAWSHDGKLANALKIVEGAAEAGADGINIHFTSLDDYMIHNYKSGKGRVSAGKENSPVFTYLQQINLSNKDWEKVMEKARSLKLLISTMCNDIPSVQFAAKHSPDMYMVPPACMADQKHITEIAKNKKPVLIGIGGSTLGEVERAIGWIRAAGNEDIIVQYGFQSYPTNPEEVHLRYLDTLKRTFGLPVSYGDHTDGAIELAITLPVAGVALGANVIEKHLTYDRSVKGEDFEAALDPKDLKRMIEQIRAVEKTLGKSHWRPLSQREIDYRGVVRKRAVAIKNLERGQKLTEKMIAYKRADEGLSPDETAPLIGRTLKTNVLLDEPITWSVVE